MRCWPRPRIQSDSASLSAAQVELETARRLNPRFANTHYWLGRLYQLQGDEEKAGHAFERAYALNPTHAQAIFELARIASRHGDREKAAELGDILTKLHAQSAPPPLEAVAESIDQTPPDGATVQLAREPQAGTVAP